jgi:hypothetical protein
MARPGIVALIVVVGMLFTYSCAQQGKAPPSEHQQKAPASEHQQEEQIPSTARIVCLEEEASSPPPKTSVSPPPKSSVAANGDSVTRVLTPKVAAQPDGVHMQIDNRLGERAKYFAEGWTGVEGPLTEGPLPKGKSNAVEDFPPGPAWIRCYLPGDIYYINASFEIVEGDSGYKSLDLECKLGTEPIHLSLMYATAGSDFGDDPVKGAREVFSQEGYKGLKEGDVVEEAGYPEEPDQPVRVVRNGKVIATIDSDVGLSFCKGQM